MRFVAPYRSLMFAPVSGTVDATYEASWLTDGRPGFPVQKTGDLSLTIAPAAAQDVDVIAVCHHAIRQAATIALTGDITNTIPTAAYPKDDISHNWFRLLDEPVSVSSLVLGVTGNSDPVMIGELYAGLSYIFEVDLNTGRGFDPGRPFEWEGEFGLIPPYDPGYSSPRRLSGDMVLDDDEFQELVDLHLSQRLGTRPVLMIPNDAVNDAWLCLFNYTEQMTGGHHFVTLEIVEIPRLRWP